MRQCSNKRDFAIGLGVARIGQVYLLQRISSSCPGGAAKKSRIAATSLPSAKLFDLKGQKKDG